MKKLNLSAHSLRLVLSAAIGLLSVLIVVIFLFGYSHLQEVSQDTQQKLADAEASESSLTNLQALRVALDQESEATQVLKSLRSSSSFPQFDTERSLRSIASSLGVSVSNITFVNEDAAAPSAPPSDKAPGGKPGPAQAGAGGARNSKISFELASSLSYNQLIHFLQAIEGSSPKLQLLGVNVSPEGDGSRVKVSTLTLEVAVTP